jgi:hypothetical protein
MLFVGLMTMGFDCVNDNALIAVNITGITGTYNINPGGTAFDGSVTIKSSDYLNIDFGSIDLNTTRIYDIRVSTSGTFAGSVSGQVLVNGTQILSFNGPWASFNTPQSLVTSPLFDRTNAAAGIAALVQAIRNRTDITLRGLGTTSQAVPSGLAVRVEVFAQVDAEL